MKNLFLIVFALFVLNALAQDTLVKNINLAPAPSENNINLAPIVNQVVQGGEIHGNFQLDAQYYNPDSAIGAPPVPEKMLMNGFANLIYTNQNFSAGIRYESYLNVMQGFDNRYKGTGIPYRFASYKNSTMEVTIGNYYDQFGSGIIFRTYEERGLGLDNAMDGFRVKYKPITGIYLKGVIGKQRSFFTLGEGIVRGIDGEMQFNELVNSWAEKNFRLTIGGSFVSKFQEDNDPAFDLPQNVGASAGRINFSFKNFSIYSEYAYKIPDPSYDNQQINKDGDALIIKSSYAQKGFGINVNFKRVDNMSFRSDRYANLTNLLLNYQPAFTRQHTYGLLTFYPYASQPTGEIAFQGEMNFKFKKESFLGGSYGTELSINYSQANGLDTMKLDPLTDTGNKGYKVRNYFGFGQKYFSDLVIEVSRKFSKKFKMTFAYANQVYNKAVIQGEPTFPTIFSNIVVVDMTYKIKSDKALRWEIQNLESRQDTRDWGQVLVEYTHGEHWFVVFQDQWNYGNTIGTNQIHYINGSVGYIKDATRITLGYGRQRAGIFCAGGVCRTVPASNGITLSITSSF